ncbi:MAG TPA: secondary thiamine-phosphate synthase enzyme YjbQ [Thermodesulfovibrionales bacterium]|nr:secondary thiamine-phosphate synthase enzyme YjbQ [Thermodesulfovibrionales bacterium]
MSTIFYADTIALTTKGSGDTIDITDAVAKIREKSRVVNGLLTVFCQGSTGAITTIEFEPGVIQDLKMALEKIAPSDVPYEHDKAWGDGNGFSHVRAALMKPSLTIPVVDGQMTLGTWQQIVFIDFDNRPRKRKVVVQAMGVNP